jgi:hypothetical protein
MLAMNYRSHLLCSLLGLTTVVGLGLALPRSSHAYIARQEIRVERLKNESYDAFIRRSELVARAAIQRAFDRDIVMSSMVLFIMGQHQGMEAPVMSVEVSRSQWQARPDSRVWATYYRMAQTLLGFGASSMPDLPQGPGTVPVTTPTNPLSPFNPTAIPTPNFTPRSNVPLLPIRRRNPIPLPTIVPSPVPAPVTPAS